MREPIAAMLDHCRTRCSPVCRERRY
jgi:hypothetical protein